MTDLEIAIRTILTSIGEPNPDREGLKGTPNRMIKSWQEIFGGYNQNPNKILSKQFNEESDNYDEMVILKNIEFFSTCEHHFLPFFGEVHIGYIPDKKIVGVSKLARLVDVFARRLQIQERMTSQIGVSIKENLEPIGTAVIINAQHFCITSRGIKKENSRMLTSFLDGAFRQTETRNEFLSMIKMESRK